MGDNRMFELKTPTTVLLSSVTNRSEHHGEDVQAAVSFGLVCEGGAKILDSLCPEVRPLLAAPGVETVALKTVCQGWTVVIEHGINEDDPITLGGCKVDNFRIKPKNDQMVELRMRVASTDLEPLRLGLLGMKVGQEITVKLTAPKGATQTTTDAEAKALERQQGQEAAGQQRIDADTPVKALGRAIKGNGGGRSART
jgi:hypothetical protein